MANIIGTPSRLDNLASAAASGTVYAQYTYLGARSVAKVAHPAVTNNLVLNYDPSNNGSFTALDQFGQVTDQNWQVNGTTVDEYQYAYDYNGNRTYRANTQSTAKSEFYAYDALNRVTDRQQGTLNGGDTGISGTPTWEEQFSLDELGNWASYVSNHSGTAHQSQTRAHNAVNETGTITHVTGSTWVSPTYDAAGNMVSGPQPGSETTNLKFIYDAWNRMVQVTDNSSTIIVTYRYDGQNHRIQKLLGSNPSSPTSYFDYYYNENWQVVEERKGGSTNPYAQYVWDARYIDAPVVRFHDSNTDGTIDDTLYYCEDANMNVTAVVDTTGTVQEHYTYDGYGQAHFFDGSWTALGSSAYDNQILFGGYRYDPETGLHQVCNRMYHPTLGKWTSREPSGSGYIDGTNLYWCFADDPINATDATGLSTRWTVSDSVADPPVVINFSYTATYTNDHRLELRPKVELWAGKLQARVNALIPVWEKAIETEYNRWKLVLTKAAGPIPIEYGMVYTPTCPKDILVSVRVKFTTGFTYWTQDQSVTVDGTAARSDITDWHLGDPNFGKTGIGVVHEVGHMLGLKDEYNYAPYPATKVVPPDAASSIMNNLGGHILERQMQEILDHSHYTDHIPGTYKLEPR